MSPSAKLASEVRCKNYLEPGHFGVDAVECLAAFLKIPP
jgi:hypothetical protein